MNRITRILLTSESLNNGLIFSLNQAEIDKEQIKGSSLSQQNIQDFAKKSFLNFDQIRFTKDSLNEIKKFIGTTNIEAISKNDQPTLYTKYLKIYEDHPAKKTTYRSPKKITGIKSKKTIGGKTVAIWRDAEVNDWMIVAPKGFLQMLDSPNRGSKVNIVANTKFTNQKEYPKAGSSVDGLTVRSDIPNQSSISATFNNYNVLPGIREIPMSDFGGPESVFYATDDFRKSRNLAEEIKKSQEINPLIIAIDNEGPYILEGAHRFVALYNLGKKSFPALVVIDKDESPERVAFEYDPTISDKAQEYINQFYAKHNLHENYPAKDLAIMVPGKYSDKYVIISPSSKFKGKWQLTWFDDKGPWGDETHNKLDDALWVTELENLDKAEVMKGETSRLQVASLALFYMGLKLASEWHELPESDELDDLLDALYELEFKYSMLKSKPEKWKGTPQRYENTLKGIGKRLLTVIKNITNKLLPVYKKWLDRHAITDPKKWAKARYEESVEIDDFALFEALENEYYRYGKGNIEEKIRTQTSKHLNNLPRLKELLEEFAKEEKDNLESERDEYEEEEFKDRMESLENPENMLNYIFDEWEIDEFINIFVNNNSELKEELYTHWYEEIVFPVWYAHWGPKGIDKTRERVEQRFKELKSLASGSISDPQKAAGMVNAAIQESHQTGKMMTYIEEEHYISSDKLEELNNMDISEWEEELKKMGLKTASVSRENIQKFSKQLQEELGLKDLYLYPSGSNLVLQSIIVEKAEQKQGKGTRAMEAIANFADQHNLRIILTTGQKDKHHGTTSSSRLKKFYKRFGFVENKGRNKDFTITENMYREPKASRRASRLQEIYNEAQKRYDEFYKKHNLSRDQEPKDIAIMIPGNGSKYSIISPSTKHKGKWQLTYFDDQGPWGDQTHNDLHSTLKETSNQNLDKAEVMKGQNSRLQVASLALCHMIVSSPQLRNWTFPLEVQTNIPTGNEIGAWGVQRDKDIHRGIDLYAPEGTKVFAVEDGTVTDIFEVPPPEDAPSGKTTQAIAIDGFSGRSTYAEIKVSSNLKVGDNIEQGQQIGTVAKIHDEESDIPNSMLHFQLSSGGPVKEWIEKQPENLLNPTGLLQKAQLLKTASEEDFQLPTLEEFLNSPIRNSCLDIPGFNSFYARKGPYYVDGEMYNKVFQIANLEATEKGKGTFSKFIEELKKKGMPIFVECILNPRLAGKLEELGFHQVNKESGLHYFWKPNAKTASCPQYMYHITKKDRLPQILEEGLKSNQEKNMTQEGIWAKTIYGSWPIFLSKHPWTDIEKDDVLLTIDASSLPLVADLPSLVDKGAYIEEDGIWWKEREEPEAVKDLVDEEGMWYFSDLLRPKSQDVTTAINLTDTAACMENIPPSKIEVSENAKIASEEKFVLLTSNPKKLREYQQYIPNLSMQKGKDLPEVSADDETVAIYKAKDNGPMTISEDTSLEVQGRDVGVNIRWMLNNLEELIGKKAKWKVLLAKNDGEYITLYEGIVNGTIVKPEEEVGEKDFGFDPFFQVDGTTKTLKQLKAESGNPLRYSARAIAANNLKINKHIRQQKLNELKEWEGDWQH